MPKLCFRELFSTYSVLNSSDEFKNSKERDLAYSKETKIEDLDDVETDSETIPLTITDPTQFFGGVDKEGKVTMEVDRPLLSVSKSPLSEVCK
jgi:hypothetical protein